jgi:hypothetical protein
MGVYRRMDTTTYWMSLVIDSTRLGRIRGCRIARWREKSSPPGKCSWLEPAGWVCRHPHRNTRFRNF